MPKCRGCGRHVQGDALGNFSCGSCGKESAFADKWTKEDSEKMNEG